MLLCGNNLGDHLGCLVGSQPQRRQGVPGEGMRGVRAVPAVEDLADQCD